jgi:hypothetical protein
LKWAAHLDKETFNEKAIKKSLRSTKIREEDFDLILAHLEHTNKMAVSEIVINDEKIRFLKLGKIGSSEKPVISEKEKATFIIESNINAIEEKVSSI